MVVTSKKKGEWITMLTKAIEIIKSLPLSTPCDECFYISDGGDHGFCSKWNQHLPEEYKAKGCKVFTENDIPF